MRRPSHRLIVTTLAAALVSATATASAPDQAALASEEQPARTSAPLWNPAQSNRLALQLGFGLGTASMSGFLGQDYTGATSRANPGATLSGEPSSHSQLGVAISLRYYGPYHLLAEVGANGLYNTSTSTLAIQNQSVELKSHNLVVEVPFLVGGHYSVTPRLFVLGALGPALHVFPRSYWEVKPGSSGEDFEASSGVGFHAMLGASFFLTQNFAVGLETRYRQLKTGSLREGDSQQTVTSGLLRQDGSDDAYRLDFSGLSVLLNLSFFVL